MTVPDDVRDALVAEACDGILNARARRIAEGACRRVLSHLEQVGWIEPPGFSDEGGDATEAVYRIRKP